MKLLIRSMLRHLRQHFLQTCLTMAVSILITGMLAVLFHFASSFQSTLRTVGLEKYGTYHYKYYTKAGDLSSCAGMQKCTLTPCIFCGFSFMLFQKTGLTNISCRGKFQKVMAMAP